MAGSIIFTARRLYIRRPPLSWWLGRLTYFAFMMRELSSVFMAYFVVITLLQVRALEHGPQDYAALTACLENPLVIALNVITFLFVTFHSITFFNAAATAAVVRVGGKRVPDILIILPHYVAWAIASAIVAWFILGA